MTSFLDDNHTLYAVTSFFSCLIERIAILSKSFPTPESSYFHRLNWCIISLLSLPESIQQEQVDLPANQIIGVRPDSVERNPFHGAAVQFWWELKVLSRGRPVISNGGKVSMYNVLHQCHSRIINLNPYSSLNVVPFNDLRCNHSSSYYFAIEWDLNTELSVNENLAWRRLETNESV